MPDTPTFGRYTEIPVEKMTAEQQAGYRSMVDGPRGRLPGPYRVWVHNPKLVHAIAPLGNHFTPGQSALSEREREITVLVICSKWGSAYPTNSHERRGKRRPACARRLHHRRPAFGPACDAAYDVKETGLVLTLEDAAQQNNAQRRVPREMLDQWRKDGA
jgi:4-carboxymuconolactone decarboxylase